MDENCLHLIYIARSSQDRQLIIINILMRRDEGKQHFYSHRMQEHSANKLLTYTNEQFSSELPPPKEDQMLQNMRHPIQTFRKRHELQPNTKRGIYKVVLRNFSQLLTFVTIFSSFTNVLEVFQFNKQQTEQKETSIVMWIRIIQKQGNDIVIKKRLQETLRTKYFIFPVDQEIKQNINQMNIFNQNFLKLFLHNIASSTDKSFPINNHKSSFEYRLYFRFHGSQNDLQIDRTYAGQSSTNNFQSQEYFIERQDEYDLNYLKNINEILKSQNTLALKSQWHNSLKHKLEEIEKNWNLYQPLYHKEIHEFTMLNMYKMYKLNSFLKYDKSKKPNKQNLYDHIYPKMSHFLDFFSMKLKIKKIEKYLQKSDNQGKKNRRRSFEEEEQERQAEIQEKLEKLKEQLNITENLADKIFYQLLREESNPSKNKHNISILINQSVELKQYVSTCQQFFINSPEWNNLFAIFFRQLRQNNNKSSQFFKQIQSERLVENQCLGCSKFYIFGQNIYDECACRSPIKVFPTILKLKQIEASLKDEICGLLNSGGGIILFNCQQKYRGIYPEGVRMTQKDKQQYQQRIYSYTNQFHPRIQVKTHLHLTFVPLLAQKQMNNKQRSYTGEEGMLKQNYRYKDRNYCQGLFVGRIKVMPADPSLLYFWFISPKSSMQSQIRIYCQVNNIDGSSTKLANRQIVKHIKKKMRLFYIKQSLSAEQRQLLMFPSGYIQHKCPEPNIGITITQAPRSLYLSNNYQIKAEERYKYLSLLVARKRFHGLIKEKFQKSRLSFQMAIPFEQQEFITAQNTVALYHNNKFQEIFREVTNNPQYVFQGRPIFVINVTSYLKLEMKNQIRLSQKEFNILAGRFSKAFPNQTLKAYQFGNQKEQKQYYLFTQTKISNLYMYYLLNQKTRKETHIEKAIFKNPRLLDKLNQAQREQCMRLLYEKKGKNDLISNFNEKRNQSCIVNMEEFCQFSEDPTTFTHELGSNYVANDSHEKAENQCQKSIGQGQKFGTKGEIIQQQRDFLYENWEEVLKEYEYKINSLHKSENLKDL